MVEPLNPLHVGTNRWGQPSTKQLAQQAIRQQVPVTRTNPKPEMIQVNSKGIFPPVNNRSTNVGKNLPWTQPSEIIPHKIVIGSGIQKPEPKLQFHYTSIGDASPQRPTNRNDQIARKNVCHQYEIHSLNLDRFAGIGFMDMKASREEGSDDSEAGAMD